MVEPPVFALPGSPNSSRLRSFLLSLGIHAVVVALLIAGPSLRPVDRSASLPSRVVPSERKIIWYTRTVELPAVAPTEPAPQSAKPRLPEFHPRQNIAATVPKPESRRQLVLQAPPELRLTQDIPSPNVLIFNRPVVAPPKPRFQVKAPARAPLQRKALPEVEAPQLRTTPASTPLLPIPLEVPRPALPRFQAPQRHRILAPRQALDAAAAPKLALAAPKDEVLARIQPKVAVERPRFIPPQAKGPRRSAPAPPAPIVADEAPAVAVAPQQPSTVIVGLDPVPGLVAPPPGNRPAQFGAGPQANGDGAGTLTASANAEVRVPNLAIAPAAAAAAAPTVTRPPLPIDDRSKLRRELLSSVSARPRGSAFARPAHPGVPAGPEMILNGATVYSMNIDMPNITSYEGSWVLRFTELGGSSPDDMLSAPLPIRKIDPKYAQSAVAEGVEGRVLLYAVIRSDGRVDQVRLVQGIDERLDTSAMAAFSKWEFQPATKNGQPVDLEAVVQIPFKAGPRKKK